MSGQWRRWVAIPLAAVALAVSTSPVLAQGEGTRTPVANTQMVTANPFLLLFEWFNAEYERKVSPVSTAGAGTSFYHLHGDDYASLGAFWRYYPQEAALVGFFFGPKAGIYRVSTSGRGKDHATFFGVGFDLGYSWLLGSRRNFAISLGAGATRLFGGDLEDVSVTVPTVRLVNVGWAF